MDPDEEYTVTRFQADGPARAGGIAAGGDGAVLVGGTGLYLRAVTDDLTFPGRFPAVAAGADRRAGCPRAVGEPGPGGRGARLHDRLAALDPVAAARIEPGNERRTGAGPRGHARIGPAVLVVRSRPRPLPSGPGRPARRPAGTPRSRTGASASGSSA